MCIVQLCPPDSHIICVDDVYGGTRRFLTSCVQTQQVEFINLQVEGTEKLLLERIKKNTSLIWIETPSNPTLRLVDIVKVAKAVKGIREVKETALAIASGGQHVSIIRLSATPCFSEQILWCIQYQSI